MVLILEMNKLKPSQIQMIKLQCVLLLCDAVVFLWI